MSPEGSSRELGTRKAAEGFVQRLSAIVSTANYEFLGPIFAEKTYEAEELKFLAGEIIGSQWKYTFTRVSRGYLNLRVLREPTSRNLTGLGEEIQLRVGSRPQVFPSQFGIVDQFITELEGIV